MVEPHEVKNVKALKWLEWTELETLIRLFSPICCDEFSEFAITILKSGVF